MILAYKKIILPYGKMILAYKNIILPPAKMIPAYKKSFIHREKRFMPCQNRGTIVTGSFLRR